VGTTIPNPAGNAFELVDPVDEQQVTLDNKSFAAASLAVAESDDGVRNGRVLALETLRRCRRLPFGHGIVEPVS